MHENDVKSAADKDKKATTELLQEETEKLNRWQYDEVNGIRLGVAKIKIKSMPRIKSCLRKNNQQKTGSPQEDCSSTGKIRNE